MNVVRSTGQPDLVYVTLSDRDVGNLIAALRKPKNDTAKTLRAGLKKVLK